MTREYRGQHELVEKPIDSPLWNEDLDPVLIEKRTWHMWHIAALWVGMAVMIPTYMIGSSLISTGMNWWQAVLTIFVGNIIVLIPMIMIGHAGTRYGIPFPVFLRLSFGTQGARVASLLRAVVACGWFGIQTWIGGQALYILLVMLFPAIKNMPILGSFVGLNAMQLTCFMLFWFAQMTIIHFGIDVIRKIETFAAPFLILLGVMLLVWAWVSVGSFNKVLAASHHLGKMKSVNFWPIFWPGLTAMVGFWATVALNIPDFTRFARSQRDQVYGQFIGLPAIMALFSFIGIFVTSATIIIYGKAIWDPVILIGHFSSVSIVLIAVIGIMFSTLCCNLAANVVSPANDFSNLFPKQIGFRMGGYITGIIGVLIFPWKLIADPQGYIFRWLLAYSALLGAVGGIMICDYYLLRKTKIDLHELFKSDGKYSYYHGWNWRAWGAFIVAVLPSLPGFLTYVGLVRSNYFPAMLNNIYNYAWFVSFFIAFVVYWVLMRSFVETRKLHVSTDSDLL